MNEIPGEARRRYEEALIACERAVDGCGRFIILLPAEYVANIAHPQIPPSSAHVLEVLRKQADLEDYFSRRRHVAFFGEGTTGEEAFLRNLALLANAAAAALAYERAR